jgi:hypothetical protein
MRCLRRPATDPAETFPVRLYADRLAGVAFDGPARGIDGVGGGQAHRFETFEAVEIRDRLGPRQGRGRQVGPRPVIEVLRLVGPPDDEPGEVQPCRDEVFVELQRAPRSRWVPATTADLRGRGIERILPTGLTDPQPAVSVGEVLADHAWTSTGNGTQPGAERN